MARFKNDFLRTWAGGQAIFGWKYIFFSINLVAKIMQSVYLCVIFHVKHKKLLFLAVLTWFLILGNSKMVAKMLTIVVGDVKGLQQRHHP